MNLRGALRHLKRMYREAAGRGEALEPDDMNLHIEIERVLSSRQRKAAAKQPRGKRGPSKKTLLIDRAFACVRRDYPGIAARQVLDILDADGLTFDDDDVELRLDGDAVLIRDLNTEATARVKKSSLRAYLNKA